MKVNTIVISLFSTLLFSCSTLNKNDKLESALRQVSQENSCNFKLTLDNTKKTISLTSQCKNEEPYFFGKVLLDFYNKSNLKKSDIIGYKILNEKNEKILHVTNFELDKIAEKKKAFDQDLLRLNQGKLKELYDRIVKDALHGVPYKDVEENLKKITTGKKFSYDGLFVMEQNFGQSIIFSASDKTTKVQLVYLLNGDDKAIYGFNIEE